ncbi:hypothetical protein TKK_0019430 [Trichogramma kaykai]|uniref:RRM domain-containing protein n=1 Tax=Trichogramma kaykai TaxID=54128 RepID=A0ABD2VSK1_9HYME
MEQISKKSEEMPLQATKLLIDNINPLVRHKSLHDCLRVFGTIRNLVLKKRKSKQRSYAFVTYSTSAEALRAYNCLLQRKTLWHPVLVIPFLGNESAKKELRNDHRTEVDCEEDSTTSEFAYYRFEKNDDDLINNLNNDCLARVFSFLPIPDRLAMAEVCRRWEVVSQQAWRSFNRFSLSPANWYSSSAEHREQHILSFAGMSIVRETSIVWLLSHCGRYVSELDLSFGSNVHSTAILINIFKLCPNVRVLNLRHYKYNNPSSIKSLADNCQRIQHLILDDSLFYNCYQDQMCRIFSKNEIKILELSGDMSDKVRRRIRCRYLRELVVSRAQNPMLMHRIVELAVNLRRFKYDFDSKETIFYRKAESEFLQCLFRSECSQQLEDLEINYRFSNYKLQGRLEESPTFTQLRKLSLRGAFFVDDKFLITICRMNPRLESVDVSNCVALTDESLKKVSQLPRLARLAIEGLSGVTDDIFDDKCTTNLQVLNCKGCVGMRTVGLMKLIRSSLLSLKILDLEGCTDINDDFVNAVVERVKERYGEPVLTLNVLNTSVARGAESLPDGLKFTEIPE